MDSFVRSEKGLTNSMINGANNKVVSGSSTNKVYDALTGKSIGNSVVDSLTENNPLANFIKDNINKGGN